MRTMAKVAAMLAAAMLAACLAGTPMAEASALTAGNAEASHVSLPYVDDVNDYGNGYIATVTCCGKAKKFDLKVSGKGAKVKKHKKRVWTVTMRKGAYYKLSVRADGGKWKSIGYRVY